MVLTEGHLNAGSDEGAVLFQLPVCAGKKITDLLSPISTPCNVQVAENSYMSTSGFVIAGEKVQAASVRLQRSVRSEKRLVAELEKLKRSGINEENSFAFMFACCGRGENHYRGRVGLEANTFLKMFPKTPLVGLFGNGELGVSYIPNFKENVPDTERISSKLKAGQFLHSFCTIFVMVSLGDC